MKRWLLYLMLAAALTAGGCAARGTGTDKPALPAPEQTPAVSAQDSPGRAAADLVPERLGRDAEGVPVLRVYDAKSGEI